MVDLLLLAALAGVGLVCLVLFMLAKRNFQVTANDARAMWLPACYNNFYKALMFGLGKKKVCGLLSEVQQVSFNLTCLNKTNHSRSSNPVMVKRIDLESPVNALGNADSLIEI